MSLKTKNLNFCRKNKIKKNVLMKALIKKNYVCLKAKILSNKLKLKKIKSVTKELKGRAIIQGLYLKITFRLKLEMVKKMHRT